MSVGTYAATVTYTATTGGSQTSVTVNFTITPPPHFSIKLAGQDITANVDQLSVKIEDALGQGAGAGSSGATQGRAATITFNTNLGPINRAIGAGQTIPTGTGPVLVRQGEIIVTDKNGVVIFGGYATAFTDTTTKSLGLSKVPFTQVEGVDYSTSLQRTIINETFATASDTSIIRFIMQKYAPWVNLQYLPTTTAFLFPQKRLRNVSVEAALQAIAGVTGYLVYVDYLKNLRYIPPAAASSAPFSISDNPNFINSFGGTITDFKVDDNSAINRVYFYGGTQISNSFPQDISPFANGNNTTFPLAYAPEALAAGGYVLTVNGVAQAVFTSTAAGQIGKLKNQGGLADALVDTSNKTITFSTAPASGATVLFTYRYHYPLTLKLTDENSHRFFGDPYLDGYVQDQSVFDVFTAIQRAKVVLAQQSFGLTTLKIDTHHGGAQSGQIMQVVNAVRGINAAYLIQNVEVEAEGNGSFVYHITLGAWNWNLIDWMLKVGTLGAFSDPTIDESAQTVDIEQILSNFTLSTAWTTAPKPAYAIRGLAPPVPISNAATRWIFYARSAPVGDGHDAYPGNSTVWS